VRVGIDPDRRWWTPSAYRTELINGLGTVWWHCERNALGLRDWLGGRHDLRRHSVQLLLTIDGSNTVRCTSSLRAVRPGGR